MELYIIHELTAIPTSLFKDSKMRKPAKARLAQTVLKMLPQVNTLLQISIYRWWYSSQQSEVAKEIIL